MSRSVEGFLKGISTYERCGTVVLILLQYRFWNVYPLVCDVEFLTGTFSGKDMAKIFSGEWLMIGWIEWWQRFVRHVCLDIIPLRRDLILLENKFFLFSHNNCMLFIVIHYTPPLCDRY